MYPTFFTQILRVYRGCYATYNPFHFTLCVHRRRNFDMQVPSARPFELNALSSSLIYLLQWKWIYSDSYRRRKNWNGQNLSQGFSTCGSRRNFWRATAWCYWNWIGFARWTFAGTSWDKSVIILSFSSLPHLFDREPSFFHHFEQLAIKGSVHFFSFSKSFDDVISAKLSFHVLFSSASRVQHTPSQEGLW